MSNKHLLSMLSAVSAVPAYARGQHGYGRGNFFDVLLALAAMVASMVWLAKAWHQWSVRQKTEQPPEKFKDLPDAALCFLGWAIMAGILALGPSLIVALLFSKTSALDSLVILTPLAFIAVLVLKRT